VLHLHSREGRETTAYVVACQPLGSDGEGWRLGARLDQPENFWGLKTYPADWRVEDWRALDSHGDGGPVLDMTPVAATPVATLAKTSAAKLAAGTAMVRRPQTPNAPTQAILERVEAQLSEERLRGILAKLVLPLQAEITDLNERLARRGRQNRFEVSLGNIPPELEEKLWQRLRQELGARVLEQARTQSAEVLTSAKAAAEQKIAAALTEFRHRLAGEIHGAEQRVQALAKEQTAKTQQQVQAGVEKLQKQAIDTGAHLSAQGDKLTGSLEQRLAETHARHREEIEQLHAAASAKANGLELAVSDLGRRISALNESVRRLESDLDEHLESVGAEIVGASRKELQEAVAAAAKECQARSAQEIDKQLDEMCGHLRTIQNRIENSFSGSLESQSSTTVEAVEKEFKELAEQSLERWRAALAEDLSAVAKNLGRQGS
jgi:hypothetical protein